MFDIGWPELLLIMVVALIVIGPKELPNAIRTVTMIVRKVRLAAAEFQNGLNDIARESGLDEVKRTFDDVEYYDPKAALENLADTDKDLLDLEDDPLAGNSILASAGKPAQGGGDDGKTASDASGEATPYALGPDDDATGSAAPAPAPGKGAA
jgi:sec-independent protein translocase protein TatB